MNDSSLPTSETSSDEAQPTLPSVMPSHTEYTSDTPSEETHIETTSSVVASHEDLNQSSQSVQQTEILTTDTYSLSQNSALVTNASDEPPASVTTTSQESQTQFDTSGTVPSGQPTVVTTLREDSSDSLTEVTSPLPIATSTGESQHSVTSAGTTACEYENDN